MRYQYILYSRRLSNTGSERPLTHLAVHAYDPRTHAVLSLPHEAIHQPPLDAWDMARSAEPGQTTYTFHAGEAV